MIACQNAGRSLNSKVGQTRSQCTSLISCRLSPWPFKWDIQRWDRPSPSASHCTGFCFWSAVFSLWFHKKNKKEKSLCALNLLFRTKLGSNFQFASSLPPILRQGPKVACVDTTHMTRSLGWFTKARLYKSASVHKHHNWRSKIVKLILISWKRETFFIVNSHKYLDRHRERTKIFNDRKHDK